MGVSIQKGMKHIGELQCLYSDYLMGCPSLDEHVKWAVERLEKEEDENDYEIAILASSSDDKEILEYTHSIITSHGDISEIELNQDQVISKIHEIFPLDPIPYPITKHKENDPKDYDGEAQLVTDFFKGKCWSKINLMNQGGYHLTYITETALAYYLPAFMLIVVSNKEPYTDILQRFYIFLGEPKAGKVIDMLSTKQKKVFRQVLCFGSPFHSARLSMCQNIKELLKC